MRRNVLRRSILLLSGALLGLPGCLAEPNEMQWAPAGGAIPQAPPAAPAAPQAKPVAPAVPSTMPMLEDPEAEFVENWDETVWAEDEATALSKCRRLEEQLRIERKTVITSIGVRRRNKAQFFCGFRVELPKEYPNDDQ